MKKMRCISILRTLGVASLLLLGACATRRHGNLPAPITFNKDGGRGGLVIVTVRLESGKKLPFAVETGSSTTVFDRSLEPQLGQRLGTGTGNNWGREAKVGIYGSPKLYLGNTPLKMTGTNIVTVGLAGGDDGSGGAPFMGLLGLDVLEHYCIQLDFNSRKMRFLATNEVHPARLGKAFSLNFSTELQGPGGLPSVHEPPLVGGASTNVIIDTGCNVDGSVPPEVFCKLGGPKKQLEPASLKLDGSKSALVEKCVWNGQTYTNLLLLNGPNLIGLGFLARHLVTFDFPNRTLYLKQTSIGQLANKELEAAGDAAVDSAFKALRRLLDKGQLPGWSKNDQRAPADCDIDSLNCITCRPRKKGDSSIYCYEFTRESRKGPWKLRKAWRTDQDDRTLEEYPVP